MYLNFSATTLACGSYAAILFLNYLNKERSFSLV